MKVSRKKQAILAADFCEYSVLCEEAGLSVTVLAVSADDAVSRFKSAYSSAILNSLSYSVASL